MSIRRRLARRVGVVGMMLLTLLCITLQPAVSAHSPVLTQQESHALLTPGAVPVLLSRTEENFSNLLREGQKQYEQGQINAALYSWQEAASDLTNRSLSRAIALSYVSIAAQDLGDWNQAETALAQAFSLLLEAPTEPEADKVSAQLLNVQGRLQMRQGNPEIAWETWTQAETAYANLNDELGVIGAQINQSQALQTMGLYRRARLQLEDIADTLQSQPDSEVKAIALRSLGSVFQSSGSLEDSRTYLERSLEIYQTLGTRADVAATLLAMGDTLRLMQASDEAQEQYAQVEAQLPGSLLSTKAKLNRFTLLLDEQEWASARQLLPGLFTELQDLPQSRESVYSRVNFADSLLSRGDATHQPITWIGAESIADLLAQSIQRADGLKDFRAQSLAVGELSKVYGYTQQWQDSQELAKQAITLSQQSNALDIAYRWQQQLGRAYHAQGKDREAIASYKQAFDTLKQVRRDLLATNADVQYSFRETVEPVYRELVSLLLLPDDVDEQSLVDARGAIEELQLAELENYFRSACIDSATESIDRLDSTAAVLYPIILPDRVEVIASFPGEALTHYRTWQPQEETNQTLDELFQYLNPVLSDNKRLRLSKQVYDWLITPIKQTLTEKNLQTLVFVLDGKFRNVPMAALHDGQQYLLEQYSVALTPGMKLLGPHFQNPKPLQALMLGLSEARDGFSALPGVEAELEQVSASINAEVLFNENFTRDNLAKEVDRVPFPVLHLATHGQFSSNLEDTFLLAWDQKITISDLDGLLRSRRQQAEPIELMVLSACQTAEGDDRATLGLAGMAIRSGARSTLATLWSVNDDSTAVLMSEFYEELKNTDLSKAQALRQAQIKILKDPQFSHPFFWSPFVLIGNWLS